MLITIKNAISLLTRHERKQALFVLATITLVAIFELFGIASLLPFITALSDAEALQENKVAATLYTYLNEPEMDIFVIILGCVFAFILAMTAALRSLALFLQIKFTKLRIHTIGSRLLKGYVHQDYLWFGDRNTSSLASKILFETNQTVSNTIFPLLQIFAHGTVALLLFSYLIYISPSFALSLVGILTFIYVGLYSFLRKPLFKMGKLRMEANSDRYRVVNEVFGGIKDIKIKAVENEMLEQFLPVSEATTRYEARIALMRQIPGIVIQAFIVISAMFALLLLSNIYGTLNSALPTFGAFAYAGYKVMPSLQQLFRHFTAIRSSSPALLNLVNDLKDTDNVQSTTERHNPSPLLFDQAIKIKDGWFKYPMAEDYALKSLNLNIPKNTSIGIVGFSGAGKTTLVDVLLGLIPLEKGELVADRCTIDSESRKAWAKSIGYVPQAIFIADDTMAANIAFGVPPEDIDMDRVTEAAKAANIHEFTLESLPNGYETMVGERGARLSGGQKQRVGIARALYDDPATVLLDEATSALDNETEASVMRAINSLANNKTIIMVAHRISTIQNCDKIVVMEKGKITAEGTFEKLTNSSSVFQRLSKSLQIEERNAETYEIKIEEGI